MYTHTHIYAAIYRVQVTLAVMVTVNIISYTYLAHIVHLSNRCDIDSHLVQHSHH